MAQQTDFGSIGMAFSCTLFLEWALVTYKKYAGAIKEDTIKIIHEWNKILMAQLKNSKYKPVLGVTGNKLMRYTLAHQEYGAKCIVTAQDVNVQSLHYVLRFDKSIRFLRSKYKENPNLTFCDLGTGLSPLAIVAQIQHNPKNIYCIDIVPEIMDIYNNAAYALCGKMPNFINWQSLQNIPEINTIISVGCLPHMPIETQKEYMKTINDKFDNFFLEIKYKTKKNVPNAENAFTLSDLQKLSLDVENVTDVEMAVIRNALSYLYNFVRAKPNRKDFLNDCRSLFLSR